MSENFSKFIITDLDTVAEERYGTFMSQQKIYRFPNNRGLPS